MFITSLLLSILSFLTFSTITLATFDPLTVTNNKVGLHILFPEELPKAAKLVNHDGAGAWGYVVIPIQATDRDRPKWQKFLDMCLENKIIPIIRVATVAEGVNWVEPNNYDLVDFANFLTDLKWPVQNRYIIIFNEVNRADEYGGLVSPENYADILSNAVDIFKKKSDDFFILPAGLDNAAIDRRSSIPWREYLWRMYRRQPDIFNKVDGWTSHAYPNPAFSSRPNQSGSNKIDSFKFDLALLKNFTSKRLPIFITEAGWSNRNLSEHQISLYYQYAFDKVWSHPDIVVVAPFLLEAQDGPFKQFSFLDKDGVPKEFANTLAGFTEVGTPPLKVENADVLEINLAPIDSTSEAVEVQTNNQTLLQRIFLNIKSLLGLLQ